MLEGQPRSGDRVLPWLNSTIPVVPANPDDAHRPLEKQHDLAAILSQIEKRSMNAGCTFPLEAKTYASCAGMSALESGGVRTGETAVGRFGRGLL